MKVLDLEYEYEDVEQFERLMGGRTIGDILLRLGTCDATGTVVGVFCGRVRREPGLDLDMVRAELKAYLANGGDMITISKAIDRAVQRSPVFRNIVTTPAAVPAPPSPHPATLPRRKRR